MGIVKFIKRLVYNINEPKQLKLFGQALKVINQCNLRTLTQLKDVLDRTIDDHKAQTGKIDEIMDIIKHNMAHFGVTTDQLLKRLKQYSR